MELQRVTKPFQANPPLLGTPKASTVHGQGETFFDPFLPAMMSQ